MIGELTRVQAVYQAAYDKRVSDHYNYGPGYGSDPAELLLLDVSEWTDGRITRAMHDELFLLAQLDMPDTYILPPAP